MKRSLLFVILAILVICLGACSSGGQDGADEVIDDTVNDTSQAEVNISGFKFDPKELSVTAGTTVTWTNLDAAPHSSTADNGEWDSGALRKNDSFSFTFDTPGTYTYHCDYYVSMTGTITVTE